MEPVHRDGSSSLLICSRDPSSRCRVSRVSPFSQSQHSTLLSASLLRAHWLDPVRLSSRGGGEVGSGRGVGERGVGGAVPGGSEWTSSRSTRQSGSLGLRTARTRPFCLSPGLHQSQQKKRSEGRTAEGLQTGCVALSYFRTEPESCRGGSG